MKQRVMIMVGLPRSGKSTWALKQGYPVVNRDSIRLAHHGQVFIPEAENMITLLEETMVKSLLLAGHEMVIIDATHITEERRDRWWRVFKGWDIEIDYHVVDVPKEVCIERAYENGQDYLVEVIERMALEASHDNWLLKCQGGM